MDAAEPEPLWREAIPDREPWRRGRMAVVLIGVLIVAGEIAMIISAMMEAELETMLVRIITTWVALLVLYLIWIGQNWARWMIAPVFALYGCWDVVWGIIGGGNQLLVIGLGALIIFCYLAISPAVYAFARHQRQRTGALEAAGIAGVFLLVLASLGSVLFAFYNYQHTLTSEATEFAQLAVHRVFINRDAEYLTAHLSATKKRMTPARFLTASMTISATSTGLGPFSSVSRANSAVITWS